ncbi:MAG: IS66 family insertion sequence element accessory protein TnpB [Dysgonamonadaceae bacterium]|nr:IS66 family insertion sequence element accessory protein TnpB [Dysgonamonadaceae bacterium]
MFSLSESNRYVVCVTGVDLRKGLDGLCGLIHYLSLSSSNGDVYVFFNRSRTRMKLVHWERGGYVVYYKRLERGRVSHKLFVKEGVGFHSLRWDELVLLLEGISPGIKRRKRYNL